MDLQYLLLLQQLRNWAGSFWTTLMLFISDFAIYGSVVLMIIIYWCLDRVQGYWIITNCISGFMINNFIKLTACVYRPWIRNPEITPPSGALSSATGYSFPSGHTQFAVSFFGSVALYNREKHPKLIIPCVICTLLTAFSRNYLGVHTPQDVLISLFVGVVLLQVLSVIFDRVMAKPKRLTWCVIIFSVFTLLSALYFRLKLYPMHYLDGELIVDPVRMADDGYTACGLFLGFLVGALVEIRYVRFTVDGTRLRKVVRFLSGFVVPVLLLAVVKKPLYKLVGGSVGHIVLYFALSFYLVAVHPAIFMAVRRRTAPSDSGAALH